MSRSLPPINSARYRGRFAIAAPELGIPYLAEAVLETTAPHDRHSHDEIQVLWVLDGDMGMEIGRTQLHVVAGQGIVLQPGRRHRVVLPEDLSRARAQIIDLRLVDAPGMTMAAFVRALPPHQCLGGSTGAMVAAAERLRQARQAAGAARSARMLSAVWDLLAELSRDSTGGPAQSHPSDASERRLRMAEQYMADHLSDPIGVEAVANHIDLSRSQLTRLMIEYKGVGPAELLRRMRIARAESLLRESTLSIKEISRVCGFATQHHFSRVFFQVTGRRPTSSR